MAPFITALSSGKLSAHPMDFIGSRRILGLTEIYTLIFNNIMLYDPLIFLENASQKC